MSGKLDGGPFHPCTDENGCNSGVPGASLRDWFAGRAITGAVNSSVSFSDAAREAYKYADSMLAERAK